MKCNNFDEIFFKYPLSFNHLKKTQKNSVAFDTETKNGIPFLLCDSLGNYQTDKISIMNMLLNGDYFKSLNLFYNLGYDKNAIIKLFSHDAIRFYSRFEYLIEDNFYIGGIGSKCMDIKPALKVNEIKTTSNGYIYYTDNNEYKVKREKQLFTDYKNNTYILGKGNKYFDLWQFFKYEQNTRLDDVSLKYLNAQKIDIKSLGYDISNLYFDETILKYCIRDCTLTKELSDMVISACNNTGIFFNRPYSCATLSADYFFIHDEIKNPIYFLYKHSKLPNSISKDIFKYAYYSYKGGRAEVTKRGVFDKVYEYDVNSMFPYQMTKLYDVNKCNWIKIFGDDLYNYDWDNLAYGFVICDIFLKPDYVNPLPFKDKFYKYAHGMFKDYNITLIELDMLFKLGIVNREDVKIKSAWIGEKYGNDLFIFKDTVHRLFNERKKYEKDDFRNSLFKILLNSLYGRLIEVNINHNITDDIDLMDINSYDIMQDDVIKRLYTSGKFFNPIYAAYILGLSRVDLFNGIYPNKDYFIGSFTDSIISEKKIKVKIGGNLGEWEKESGNMVMIGSGVYKFEGKKVKIRTRGLHLREATNDNLFGYDFNTIISKPYKQNKVIKLKESVIQNKINEFNTFKEVTKRIDLNFDKKRKWDYDFNCLEDVYKGVCDSEPLKI